MSEDRAKTVRDRRRERHSGGRRMELPTRSLKKLIVPGIVFLLVFAMPVMGILFYSPDDRCPGHWHAQMDVYVRGQLISYDPRDPTNDFGNEINDYAPGAHIHADDGVLHMHPARPSCRPLDGLLRHLGTEVSSSTIVLDAQHGAMAGLHRTEGNEEVRIYHQPYGSPIYGSDEWNQIQDINRFLGRQIGNGDRVFIILDDPERMPQYLQQARELNPVYLPPEGM